MDKATIYDKAVFLLSAGAYVALFIFLVSGYTGNKVLPLHNNNRLFLETTFPESWLFFSKSPDEPMSKLYEVKDGKLRYVDQRGFSPRFAFGINRENRIIGVEISNILKDLGNGPGVKTYRVCITVNSDVNQYISPDTLQFNPLPARNTHVIKGKIVIAISPFRHWPERNSQSTDTVTLVPVDLLKYQ